MFTMLHPFKPLVYTEDAIVQYGEPTRLSSDRSRGSDNPISVDALYAGYEPGSYLRGEHRCRAMLDRGVMVEDPLSFVRYRIERPDVAPLEGVVGILDLEEAVVHLHEGVMASAVAARRADIERAGAFLEPVVLATTVGADGFGAGGDIPMRSVVYGDEIHSVGAMCSDATFDSQQGIDRTFVVIDGHHRIAAAQNHSRINGIHPSILAMVVDIESPGLVVVPQHRVLGGSPIDLERLGADLIALPYARGDAVPSGAVAIVGGDISVLLTRTRTGAPSPEHRISSVTLSEELVEPLGLWVQGFATREVDAYAELDRGALAVAIMGDLDISDIVATASKGLVLPEKTTCFSPKVAVGLVGVTA